MNLKVHYLKIMGELSENLKKLKELREKLCETQQQDSSYKDILIELKCIVDSGKDEIDNVTGEKGKIKCYENMCFRVMNLLGNVKL